MWLLSVTKSITLFQVIKQQSPRDNFSVFPHLLMIVIVKVSNSLWSFLSIVLKSWVKESLFLPHWDLKSLSGVCLHSPLHLGLRRDSVSKCLEKLCNVHWNDAMLIFSVSITLKINEQGSHLQRHLKVVIHIVVSEDLWIVVPME